MTTQPIHTSLDASATLSKAVIRTAERLHLSKTELAKVLGLSPPTITRLYSGHYVLEEKRKEWEFALLLNRVFRSLDSILANEQAIRQWLNSNNFALGVNRLNSFNKQKDWYVSFNTWTPHAVSSNQFAWSGSAWSIVEAQYYASTMKIVDKRDE